MERRETNRNESYPPSRGNSASIDSLFSTVSGLFSYSHMDFNVDRNTNGSGDPSLAEMTIKALRILAKNPEGYLLFVEGTYDT